jgi:hypothetical protein
MKYYPPTLLAFITLLPPQLPAQVLDDRLQEVDHLIRHMPFVVAATLDIRVTELRTTLLAAMGVGGVLGGGGGTSMRGGAPLPNNQSPVPITYTGGQQGAGLLGAGPSGQTALRAGSAAGGGGGGSIAGGSGAGDVGGGGGVSGVGGGSGGRWTVGPPRPPRGGITGGGASRRGGSAPGGSSSGGDRATRSSVAGGTHESSIDPTGTLGSIDSGGHAEARVRIELSVPEASEPDQAGGADAGAVEDVPNPLHQQLQGQGQHPPPDPLGNQGSGSHGSGACVPVVAVAGTSRLPTVKQVPK